MNLVPLSKLSSYKGKKKPVSKKMLYDVDRDAKDLLERAAQVWANMYTFRKDMERNRNYTYGKQWNDMVCIDGRMMTEEDYIRQQGRVPLKNNLIRRFVKTVLGVWHSQDKEPTCTSRDRDEQKYGETMTTLLQYNRQMNRLSELDGRAFEEFMIYGAVCQRKCPDWRKGRYDEYTDNVDLQKWFVDGDMKDPRNWDADLIGEIHDISHGDLLSKFAKTPSDKFILDEIYPDYSGYIKNSSEEFGYRKQIESSFYIPKDANLCRVFEIWSKEEKPRYHCHDYATGDCFKCEIKDKPSLIDSVNNKRIQEGTQAGMDKEDIPLIEYEWCIDRYWYFRFVSPDGYVLDQGETPFEHGEHPYTYKLYPFVNGEIHSYVADVIDQQRYVNRLITMYDFIMSASAKGLLLFPQEAKPDDYSWKEIGKMWGDFKGILPYKSKNSTALPQQISSNSTNIGISELLNIQLKFFEDIAGVSGALQGKPGFSGTSASKYQQETQNATMSLLDILEAFSSFLKDGALKDVQNIQQTYDDRMIRNIVGKDADMSVDHPERVKDLEFDLSIAESQTSMASRQVSNDFLLQLLNAHYITLEQMLNTGSFPYADKLLSEVNKQKEAVQNGQQPQQLSPELQQQVQQGANMPAVNNMYSQLA